MYEGHVFISFTASHPERFVNMSKRINGDTSFQYLTKRQFLGPFDTKTKWKVLPTVRGPPHAICIDLSSYDLQVSLRCS